MKVILDVFKEAFLLILRLDSEFLSVLSLSILVSGSASILAALFGVPFGVALAEGNFKGKRLLLTLTHAFMALPPVVAGLVVFLILMRSGPLGSLRLIFTPASMIIVQTILAFPIVAGLTHASVSSVDPRYEIQARGLGASRLQAVVVKVRQARMGVVAAVIAGFGRVLAEVGAVMIVGGNIKSQTRVLTTHLLLYARQGKYEMALADGIVLIMLSVLINAFLTKAQFQRARTQIAQRITSYPS